ncbi:NAD(P)H-binding protein [Nocardia sp. CDC159]|uniref:NAD(P)H-binding protein n=1 Tax=Nocardia pulmonis TaxID=2951408 RepID=A0A9X2EHF3_9NOCA|nr:MULTISPECIES: NAD(P)H-binding protein [Nocardia]MCM6778713.1 NAD(P)H-binding protein [Nocardia pulmonis]MCM6791602.1 NAD(P)H-binding protein [Nocardia sp. CDC159]
MKFTVFGAAGRTGLHVVKQALDKGHTVTAAVRRPEEFPFTDPGLQVVRADARDIDSVERAVVGHDAVISVLGGTYTRKPVSVFSEGLGCMIKAMTTHDVRRLVCVSSVCVAGKAAPGETFMFRTVLLPLLLTLGRTAYYDMGRMEHLVRNSGLDWTIVRASGLFDGSRITNYTIAPSSIPGRYTSRVDLADALVREAAENRNVGRCVDVVTIEGTPRPTDVFRRDRN